MLLKEYSVSFKFMLCAKETTVTGAKFRCSCLSLRAYINIFSRERHFRDFQQFIQRKN